ncbi:LamG-like jellyroll fold domain-containing protein [Hymenobacter cavernae]|uniref:Fibronectin type-III domain-containing protein n=1 Tax=Hymenobacter cavernae TaxID=2044852 RepID=A0ABQ1ULB9_9BACT|nr:LamG-like jellyroll fold domain-containing protein [Hymenobacter cavernae]GGF21858.1 hypothetical protein GCM10011383_36870 [Hymenobacter cavernae]
MTGVTVNGVAANTASFINNTATSITFQVPATAGASGTTSVTTAAGGTASVTNFTTVAAVPPGNALALDGTGDYVAFGSIPALNSLGTGNFTLEAWVYYNGGTGAQSIIRKTGDYNLYLNGNTLHAEVWPNGIGNSTWQVTDGSLVLPANRWVHVAAVWTKAAATLQLYVNGVADGTGATATGQITLYDQTSNAYAGTLTNFALTGTASNWVESYAMLVPSVVTATAVTTNGFAANWTAPNLGTVTSYLLEVSTSSTFATTITSSPFTIAAGTTTHSITGLNPNTTYYYRLRADKTSVTGQGAYSNVIAMTTCALPVAAAKNVTVALSASGNASVTAAQVNNGSNAACGPVTLSLTESTERLLNETFDTNTNGWTATYVDGSGGWNTNGNPGGMFILNSNGTSTDSTYNANRDWTRERGNLRAARQLPQLLWPRYRRHARFRHRPERNGTDELPESGNDLDGLQPDLYRHGQHAAKSTEATATLPSTT